MQFLGLAEGMIITAGEGNFDLMLSRGKPGEGPRLGGTVVDGPSVQSVLNVGFIDPGLKVRCLGIHDLDTVGLDFNDRLMLSRIFVFVDESGEDQGTESTLTGKRRTIWHALRRGACGRQFFPLAISSWERKEQGGECDRWKRELHVCTPLVER